LLRVRPAWAAQVLRLARSGTRFADDGYSVALTSIPVGVIIARDRIDLERG
jgi:hypothetical protein